MTALPCSTRRRIRTTLSTATPFKRDPLRELAIECEKQGIKLGFYYSQAQDWTAPGGASIGGHWDKAQDGDFDHLSTH